MSFLWPGLLWLLLLLPVFVWLYLRLQQRRRLFAARYGSLGLVRGALGRGPGLRRHLPPALFLIALAILLLALARPQMAVNLPRLEGTVLLAFDVSASMAADDLAPTRLEAAKAAAQAFVQRQPGSVEVGVVAFSNSGIAVQVPTNDQAAVLAAINRLAPQRGTSLGQGILASLNAIAVENGAASPTEGEAAGGAVPLPVEAFDSSLIVLFTDGENTAPPDPFAAAQAAAELGVRIYTVGLGSPQGATLQLEGFTVHSMLDEPTLQQIAALTGGAYYNAASAEDLYAVYDSLQTRLVVEPEKIEVTSLFAGLGILVLLIGGTLSLLWFGRLP